MIDRAIAAVVLMIIVVAGTGVWKNLSEHATPTVAARGHDRATTQ